MPLAVRNVEPRPGLVRLPAAVATPERIAPLPEDIGVPDYMVRGRGCVIVSDVERALEYADKGIVKALRKEWAAEATEEEDFAVITRAEARKMLESAKVPSGRTLSPRGLMVLFEGGFDLVLLRTEKPEGAALRDRLRAHVLPKLRRGEAVAPGGHLAPGVAGVRHRVRQPSEGGE